jgi:hypothetical protein
MLKLRVINQKIDTSAISLICLFSNCIGRVQLLVLQEFEMYNLPEEFIRDVHNEHPE